MKQKLTIAFSLALILMMLFATGVLADTITNNITAGGNDTVAQGVTTTITYKVNATGGDGEAGCNVSDGTPMTLTITVPANVTASTTSLIFTVCGVPGQQTVTYSSNTVGDYAITTSFSDSGPGTYINNTSFTLHVTGSVTPSDITPPVISYTVNGVFPPAPDGANGWYVTDAFVDWTVTDSESTVVIDSGCVDTTINYDTTGVTLSCSAHSAGGDAGPVSVTIKRDATKPSVSLVGGPADGGSYYFGFIPAAPTCNANDATSGLDGACSVSGYGTTVGNHTVTATAKDMAGNTNSVSATYEVLSWTLYGFYQPVDMSGVWNVVKGGRTVPLKFNIFAGTTELTDISYVDKFVVKGVVCPSASVATDDIELTTTGGTNLRYDTIEGQFIQNWQTPKISGVCYKVTMFTDDGSSLTSYFMLK